MVQQLALDIELPIHHTLQNFQEGPNQIIIRYLQHFLQNGQDRQVYLWGSEGAGKTHLLQASCHELVKQGLQVSYVPLAYYKDFSPQLLLGAEQLDLLCLDDIQMIASQSSWEEEIFHCYNRLQQCNSRLMIAADVPPQQLSFALADLKSRLTAGTIFHLQTLTDEQKLAALQNQAKVRGLELSSEVGQFLLAHCPRNMHQLFDILERLDKASLAAQRKLTIPFVKEII